MHLSELNIYPIKSLRGISVREAKVEDRGLRFDRRWMLVDEKRQFMTQREVPKMAMVEVEIQANCLVTAFNDDQIEIPIAPETGENVNVKIWSSTVKAEFYPKEVNQWFSEALGVRCSLVHMSEQTKRKVNPDYAVRKFEDTVSFADGYPFMLIGESTVEDLNSKLDVPLPMNRFRPNFVVAGSEPFAEDKWKKIRIGPAVFHVVKPSERCIITTTDQKTGERGKEPLATLSRYRKLNGKILFGQNLIAEGVGATVKVGDKLEILESR